MRARPSIDRSREAVDETRAAVPRFFPKSARSMSDPGDSAPHEGGQMRTFPHARDFELLESAQSFSTTRRGQNDAYEL
jgi:hypothetical protein